MTDKTFCRIGVFYDGSYFNYAQRYFYHNRGLGWLDFKPFHRLLEDYVRSKDRVMATTRSSMRHGSKECSHLVRRQTNN